MGSDRQAARKEEAKRGLEIAPPTYEESVVIHRLMKKVKSGEERYTSIGSTRLQNNMLMHIEDKNLSGKIFGGHILRNCYEIGWLCAARYLPSSIPKAAEIDEVQFLAPV
jgi:acyl-coenzyme A thioesterase 9